MKKIIKWTVYAIIWLIVFVTIKVIELECDITLSWFILVFISGLFHKKVFNYIFN